jgi:hypothetical protein
LKLQFTGNKFDRAKEALYEEAAGHDNILRLVAKAKADAVALDRSMKWMTKATVDNLNAKLEINEIPACLDQALVINVAMEHKA